MPKYKKMRRKIVVAHAMGPDSFTLTNYTSSRQLYGVSDFYNIYEYSALCGAVYNPGRSAVYITFHDRDDAKRYTRYFGFLLCSKCALAMDLGGLGL